MRRPPVGCKPDGGVIERSGPREPSQAGGRREPGQRAMGFDVCNLEQPSKCAWAMVSGDWANPGFNGIPPVQGRAAANGFTGVSKEGICDEQLG